MDDLAILVPLKDFRIAKERLRSAGVPHVTNQARTLARGVLVASAPRHVIVVTESEDVRAFAHDCGSEAFLSRATTLNEAVLLAYQSLEPRFERVVIAHGDLAHPEGLGSFAPEPGLTIVTDRRERGTNVLALPTGLDFHFSYGHDSKDRHVREARRLEMDYRVVADSPWALDIDEPGDLA